MDNKQAKLELHKAIELQQAVRYKEGRLRLTSVKASALKYSRLSQERRTW